MRPSALLLRPLIYLMLVAGLGLTACKGSSAPPSSSLTASERPIPQDVIARCDSLLRLPANQDYDVQMRLRLERIDAQTEVLDDSLTPQSVRPVVTWAETHGTETEQVKAYFAMGVAEYLQMNTAETTRWFKRAFDVADVSNTEMYAYLHRTQVFTDYETGRWLEDLIRVKLDAQHEAARAQRQWFISTIVILSLALITAIGVVIYLVRLQRLHQRASALEEEKAALEARWRKRSQAVMSVSDTFTIFKDAAENGWAVDDERVWENLFNTVDESYPSFASVLRERGNDLSQTDIQLCYLLRIGLKQSDIARLWKQHRATISRRCKHIEETVGNVSDIS